MSWATTNISDEVANLIVYLCSAQASATSGASLPGPTATRPSRLWLACADVSCLWGLTSLTGGLLATSERLTT
jgi:hypothetical protein